MNTAVCVVIQLDSLETALRSTAATPKLTRLLSCCLWVLQGVKLIQGVCKHIIRPHTASRGLTTKSTGGTRVAPPLQLSADMLCSSLSSCTCTTPRQLQGSSNNTPSFSLLLRDTLSLLLGMVMCVLQAPAGPPKLLVFGGRGFVGSAICKEALKTGLHVVSITPSGQPLAPVSGTKTGQRPCVGGCLRLQLSQQISSGPATKGKHKQQPRQLHAVGRT